jgi:hypothetical protein
MYNRYVERDHVPFAPIPEETICPPPPPPPKEGFSDLIQKFLDRFHLDRIDSGDLLLLGLLFFLYREGADEELLAALALLLIL